MILKYIFSDTASANFAPTQALTAATRNTVSISLNSQLHNRDSRIIHTVVSGWMMIVGSWCLNSPTFIGIHAITNWHFCSLHDHCNTSPPCHWFLLNFPCNFQRIVFCKFTLVKNVMPHKLVTQMDMFPCLFLTSLSLVVTFLDNMHQ